MGITLGFFRVGNSHEFFPSSRSAKSILTRIFLSFFGFHQFVKMWRRSLTRPAEGRRRKRSGKRRKKRKFEKKETRHDLMTRIHLPSLYFTVVNCDHNEHMSRSETTHRHGQLTSVDSTVQQLKKFQSRSFSASSAQQTLILLLLLMKIWGCFLRDFCIAMKIFTDESALALVDIARVRAWLTTPEQLTSGNNFAWL